MDQPKLERLLRLMKLLTTNNRHTVGDIASRLDMSVRTVYRYIDTFRSSGFVIKQREKVYSIDTSSPYFRDISDLIHFSEEEAYVLKTAIESIDENNVLKQNLKKKLYTVYDYRILAETVTSGKNARNVNRLIEAIEGGKQIILRNYTSPSSNKIRNRLVEPFEFTTNYIQVWAYDTESKTNKLFKVARIDEVEVLETPWRFSKHHQSGFIDVFRISSFNLYPVKLKLGMRAAMLLQEEYPLAQRDMKKVSSGKWVFETNVCSYEGVGRFVMGLYDDIKVLGTAEFRNYISSKFKK
jgi:predicted DNA-binding transcriptional regulator YafY